jgi:hypothetical protein
MVWAAAALSVLLYSIPLAVVLVARAFRSRSPWEIALDIPFVVSIDLLSVLVMSFAMRLEAAALLSRACWLIGGIAWLGWRRTQGARWVRPVLGRNEMLGVLGSVVLCVALSALLSRTYQIWDRYWHMPLVTSLRGQKLPFSNVYEPGLPFAYHYAADVMAAMFQTFSFCVISSDMALAQAHDVVFAAIGATVALLAVDLGPVLVALSGPILLLHGPVPWRGGAGHDAIPQHGYSYSDFMINSMRPHVALAGLLLVGFIGAIAVRLRSPDAIPIRRTLPTLCAVAAALAITDEASLLWVGIAAFLAWIIEGNAIAERRAQGFAGLVALASAIALTRLLFVGLGSGPVESVTWVEARIPGLLAGARTPLYSRDGLVVLITDFFPFLMAVLGLALFARSQRDRRHGAMLVFAAAPIVLTFLALTHVEVNGTGTEAKRFFVAPCFVALTLATLWFSQMPRRSLSRAMVVVALTVPAACTVFWLIDLCPIEVGAWRLRGPFEKTERGAYGFDCRTIAGAELGQSPTVSYIDTAAWYRYAACSPVYAPGTALSPWRMKVASKGQRDPKSQLPDVERMVSAQSDVPAYCLSGGTSSDPVCAYAVAHASCAPNGSDFVRCILTPDHRRELARRRLEAAVRPSNPHLND